MQINPYLPFDGRCDEAFAYYASVFGGEITMRQTYGGSPMADQCPPDFADKVMHARVQVAGHILMGSDSLPGRYEAPRGISLSVSLEDTTEAGRIFESLAKGGSIQMPLQETFWASAFGMLVDRYGIGWMVNCEKSL